MYICVYVSDQFSTFLSCISSLYNLSFLHLFILRGHLVIVVISILFMWHILNFWGTPPSYFSVASTSFLMFQKYFLSYYFLVLSLSSYMWYLFFFHPYIFYPFSLLGTLITLYHSCLLTIEFPQNLNVCLSKYSAFCS